MSSEIEYKGARFYKCALQVNPASYGCAYQSGAHDFDEPEYNQKILEKCGANNIEVVGLADHGRVDSSESIRIVLESSGIIVFPGFEIASSQKIHMVCLYPEGTTSDYLMGYLAQLMGEHYLALKDDATHPSSLSCEEISKIVMREQRGFWYAAHMTGKNGLLRLSGPGDNYKHLWRKDDCVIAGQIPGSLDGLPDNYKCIIENKNSDYKRVRPIAIINAKDIVKPEDMDDKSASCWVKMTEPNMVSFRNSFYDIESRIRLGKNEPPNHHTRIQKIKFEGGLWGDEDLVLSDHLNVIIGGHGTGKSTFIESLRHVFGREPNANLKKIYESLCKNNLANSRISATVCSHAQGQNKYKIIRRYGEPAEVRDSEERLSALSSHEILPDIEIYSQSEILEIAKSNNAQLELLGRFLPKQHQQKEVIIEIQHRLQKNREKLVSALDEKDALESRQNQIPRLKEQIQQLQKLGLEERLRNIGLLEKEDAVFRKSEQEIKDAISWLSQGDGLFNLDFFSDSHLDQFPNSQLLSEIRTTLEKLKEKYDKVRRDLRQETDKNHQEIASKKEQWQIAKGKLNEELHEVINQLPNQGGKSGQQIAKEYRDLQKKLVSTEGQSNMFKHSTNLVNALENERNSILSDYKDKSFARSKELKDAIDELNHGVLKGRLQIEFKAAEDKSELKKFLTSLSGIGDSRVKWIDQREAIFPMGLAQKIKEKNKGALLEDHKSHGLTDSTVDILFKMSEGEIMKLEEVEMKDRIVIKLNVKHTEDDAPDFRELDNLSTGQKCIAILNILLLNNNDPLVMDQPEDNLDNAFIADRIVKDLRIQKNHRQFIFATHNANIPVFGDAELISVLKMRDNKAVIDDVGSIDKASVQQSAAQILEGGESAFTMRKQKYGF